MQARKLILAAAILAANGAHAQFGNAMNPLSMLMPLTMMAAPVLMGGMGGGMMNPMSMMSPMGGFGGGFGNSGFGGNSFGNNSFGGFGSQQMYGNPYMKPPAAPSYGYGMPFGMPAPQQPAAPAYGYFPGMAAPQIAPAYGYGMPYGMPAMPAAQQRASVPAYGYFPGMAAPQIAPAQATTQTDPNAWMNMFTPPAVSLPVQPAAPVQQAMPYYYGYYPAMPAAAAPMAQTLPKSAPQPTAQPVVAPAAQAVDPMAGWMQMFMPPAQPAPAK